MEDKVLKCPFPKCNTGELPVHPKNIAEHIIITKDTENHFHVHAPIKDKALIQDFVVYLLKEAGIAYSIAPRPAPEQIPQDDKNQD